MEGLEFMATKTVNNKIFKQIGDEVIELQGVELQEYLAKEAEVAIAKEQLKEELKAKEIQRQAILDRIGLTADELKTIIG